MKTNLTTQPDRQSNGRIVRRRHVALVVLGAAVVVASAGGIAVARGGGAQPATVPASAPSTPGLSCLQLAQMGPAGNATLSEAALANWRQMWSDAHC